MARTGQDYVVAALRELGVLNAVDPPSPEDAAMMLGLMNRIFDDWNADEKGVYAWDFAPFTLTPNLSPHTIGPTGTFVVDSRPSIIYGASLVLNNVTPNVNTRIGVRSRQWYLNLGVPDLATTIPTDLYYDPQWPNGDLFFWPVPTVAYGVQLLVPVLLSEVELITAISMPPGYRSALELTMAEQGAPSLKVPLSPETQRNARLARARIFDVNTGTVSLRTADAGMPTSGTPNTFNYLTRQSG